MTLEYEKCVVGAMSELYAAIDEYKAVTRRYCKTQ